MIPPSPFDRDQILRCHQMLNDARVGTFYEALETRLGNLIAQRDEFLKAAAEDLKARFDAQDCARNLRTERDELQSENARLRDELQDAKRQVLGLETSLHLARSQSDAWRGRARSKVWMGRWLDAERSRPGSGPATGIPTSEPIVLEVPSGALIRVAAPKERRVTCFSHATFPFIRTVEGWKS